MKNNMNNLRPWQHEFMAWFAQQPCSKIVNLCGGPWGKTWLAVHLRAQYPSLVVAHCTEEAADAEEFLCDFVKVRDVQALGKKVVIISIDPLMSTGEFRDDILHYELDHQEPRRVNV
jgi:hypothetical protein